MPARNGYSSPNNHTFQSAWSTLSLDFSLIDGSTATGPDFTDSPPVDVTGGVNLGALLTVTSIQVVGGFLGNLTGIVEFGASSTSWTTVGTLSGAHGGSFSLQTDTFSGLSLSAQYIRVSLEDDAGRVSLREITITTGSGTAYSEPNTEVKAGAKPSETDTAAFAWIETNKLGLKPASDDSQTLAGGGIAYADTGQANIGAKPSQADVRTASETVTAAAGLFLIEEDVQQNVSTPARYSEAPRVLTGLRSSSSELSAMVAVPRVKVGLKPSSLGTGAWNDTVEVKAGVAIGAGVDGYGYADVPATVKAGVKASGADTSIVAETQTAKAGAAAPGTAAGAYLETGRGALGVKPSGLDAGVAADTVQANIGTAAPGSAMLASVDAATAKAGAAASIVASGGAVPFLEVVQAALGAKTLASTVEARGYADLPVAAMGLHSSCVDSYQGQE